MNLKSFNLKTYNKILPFKKKIEVDSDKSISIRSFLIGSISQGISSVKNVLESEDVLSTVLSLKKLGVKITRHKPKQYLIKGKGLGSLFARKNTKLDFGNSGTLARLLIGILATTPNIEVKVKGDKSLNKRSMKKVIELMSRFGATFIPKKKFKFPFKIISSTHPVGIHYRADVSAQLKSAVIFAALNSYGCTTIIENKKSRDHTERMLLNNSKAIKITNLKKKLIKINGKTILKSVNVNVPSDPSAAAFFVALTILNKNSSIVIKNVGLNPTRIGFYKLLKKHGAKIKFKNIKSQSNELRGDVLVESSNLSPIHASRKYYVNSTDEYPILFIIASLIKGTSTFSGIADLTNKESNRITEMQKILKQIGVKSIASKNKLKIFGRGISEIKKGIIKVPNLRDHRICMSSFILAILTGSSARIKNFETVYTSSPSFLKIMKTLGAKFEIQK